MTNLFDDTEVEGAGVGLVNQGVDTRLLSIIKAQKLEPMAIVCCYALMPFTGLLENLGIVLAADRSNAMSRLFQLFGSRPALEDFIKTIELSQLEQVQHAGD